MRNFIQFITLWSALSIQVVLSGGMYTTTRLFDPTLDCTSPGAIAICFYYDDLGMVTAENPLYVRARFVEGFTLCQTLVDIVDSASGHEPIYLALYMNNQGDFEMNAGPGAVSIVRWRAGESEIWLKFSEPTSGWLMGPQGATSPSLDNMVCMDMGHAAIINGQYLEGASSTGGSNRKGNGDLGDTVLRSTHICLSYDEQVIDPDASVDYNITSFVFSNGVTTADDVAAIVLGDQLAINFSGRKELGFQEYLVIQSELDLPVSQGSGWLYPWHPTGKATLDLSFSFNNSNIPFYQGSRVTIDVSTRSNSGFELGSQWTHPSGEMGYLLPGFQYQVTERVDSPGFAYALDRDGFIDLGGVPHAQVAYLEYDGSAVFPLDQSIKILGSISSDADQQISAQVSIAASSQPYAIQAGSGLWANTQFYCPGTLLPLWTGNVSLSAIEDFGDMLTSWPQPRNVNNLLGLIEF